MENYAGVPGLYYIPNFVSAEREAQLAEHFDEQPWNLFLDRRVQHYGYEYDYKKKTAERLAQPIPSILNEETSRLVDWGWFARAPEQVIVNEYKPGQGIAAHADAPCFGPAIASVTLLSPCVMHLSRGDTKKNILLERRSVLVLTGEARTKWRHSIAARAVDRCELHDKSKANVVRGRRMSVTFRTMAATNKKRKPKNPLENK